MPTLPTITVSQPVADRLLAAFGDVATYKAWLMMALRQEVLQRELLALDATHEADKRAHIDDLNTTIGIEMTPP